MDIRDKMMWPLPKAKLSRLADLKIKSKLYRLIVLSYLKNIFAFNFKPLLLHKGLMVAMVFLFVFFATSIFAYASNNVVPGDYIYPLKIAVEKVEQKMALNETAKIAVHEKISVRRLQEAVSLSKENSDDNESAKVHQNNINASIQKNIVAAVDSHQAVVESINNLRDSAKVEKEVNKAKDYDKAKTEYLNTIADYANSNQEKDEQTLDKINKAQEVITNQEYKHKKDKDGVKEDKEDKQNNNNEEDENNKNQERNNKKSDNEDQNQDINKESDR